MVVGWKRRKYRDELHVKGILIRRCHTVTEGTRHTACLLNRVVFFLKFIGSWAKSRSRTDSKYVREMRCTCTDNLCNFFFQKYTIVAFCGENSEQVGTLSG